MATPAALSIAEGPEELHTRGYDLSALALAAVILRFKLASPKLPLDVGE